MMIHTKCRIVVERICQARGHWGVFRHKIAEKIDIYAAINADITQTLTPKRTEYRPRAISVLGPESSIGRVVRTKRNTAGRGSRLDADNFSPGRCVSLGGPRRLKRHRNEFGGNARVLPVCASAEFELQRYARGLVDRVVYWSGGGHWSIN